MQRREVICRNCVPTHPSGAAAYLATAHLSWPANQEMACWLLFPPPASLFRFWADLPKNFKDLRNPPSLNNFQERPKVARAFESQGPAGNSEGLPETLPSQGLGSFAASGSGEAWQVAPQHAQQKTKKHKWQNRRLLRRHLEWQLML